MCTAAANRLGVPGDRKAASESVCYTDRKCLEVGGEMPGDAAVAPQGGAGCCGWKGRPGGGCQGVARGLVGVVRGLTGGGFVRWEGLDSLEKDN